MMKLLIKILFVNTVCKCQKNLRFFQPLPQNDYYYRKTQFSYNNKHCNKVLSHRNSRWVHEKVCKQKTQVENYQYNKNINIQNNNNNNNNKTINIYVNGVGHENLKDIPYNDVIKILSNGGSKSILDYIKSVYFNKDLPENHSFCTTNIKSPYLSVLNNNTKTPELFQKKYYFDELIKKVNDRIKQLYKNYINDTFVTENKDKIKNMLYSNQNFVEKFYGDKILNSLIKEIEALTYNYRQTVIDTWNGKNNNYLLIRKINKLIKKIELNKLPHYESYEYYKYHLIIENLFKKLEKQIIKYYY